MLCYSELGTHNLSASPRHKGTCSVARIAAGLSLHVARQDTTPSLQYSNERRGDWPSPDYPSTVSEWGDHIWPIMMPPDDAKNAMCPALLLLLGTWEQWRLSRSVVLRTARTDTSAKKKTMSRKSERVCVMRLSLDKNIWKI